MIIEDEHAHKKESLKRGNTGQCHQSVHCLCGSGSHLSVLLPASSLSCFTGLAQLVAQVIEL
uniref:Uncharacterized protein n=1 Tax=Oryza sativa subsp. japonica TaxID=39947 RepID=Q6YVR9_ORYSJ|nr:hypothetical protein [Oryza sativa Japonica Group]BAD10657.1 hypothetical protein [Oryza sativa Japonica Group]